MGDTTTTTTALTTKRTVIGGVIATIFGALLLVGVAVPVHADTPLHNWDVPISLCHRTGDYATPYEKITILVSSAEFQQHIAHTGPVFFPAIPVGQAWGDIIPPVDLSDYQYAGLNWSAEGQALWNNNCNLPQTTTTTTTQPETTTTTEPVTTTTQPVTTTTQPETTTTGPVTTCSRPRRSP